MSDWQLIQEYAAHGSEQAFGELVKRHLDWVYSVAFRQVGNSQLAEDVSQSVFILLARKARNLHPSTLLNGWLFRTTRFVAARALRNEIRRQRREEIASTMISTSTTLEDQGRLWEQLAPHLDQAVAALSDTDRSAVLLRYYEKQPLHEIGQRLGVSEDAAKKRISRAIDKMRAFLTRRGVSLSSAALATLLAEKTVRAAHATLAATVLKVTVTHSSISTALPYLVQETLTAWRWAKLKLAAGWVVLGLTGTLLTLNFTLWQEPKVKPNLSPMASAKTIVPAEKIPLTQNFVTSASQIPTTYTGIVWNEQQRPISGARVWIGMGQNPAEQTVTDPVGGFRLEKRAGKKCITVMAEGYATDQQEADLSRLSEPLIFRLSPARPLRIHVVDVAGQDMDGAVLALENWWGSRHSLHFRQPVDAHGRLTWLSAPKGELEFCAYKTGYKYSRENKLQAHDQEHKIVLHSLTTIIGDVTDRQTGVPIADFKAIPGYYKMFSPGDETKAIWDYSRQQSEINGFYSLVLEEEDHPKIRIEAPGYEIAEAKPLSTNALDGTCVLNYCE